MGLMLKIKGLYVKPQWFEFPQERALKAALRTGSRLCLGLKNTMQIGTIMVCMDRSEDFQGQGQGCPTILCGDHGLHALTDAVGKGFQFQS